MDKMTLLVDMGWLTRSRLHIYNEKLLKTTPDHIKEAVGDEFEELLARSISRMLRQFPDIDNIILCCEGGSWRKSLKPKTEYKATRVQEDDHDWDYIYKRINSFIDRCKQLGITCGTGYGIEGDDWAWWWSEQLNQQGISTMIWTSDCDLKQLVKVVGNAFTCWYNEKNGLVLPLECKYQDDPLEAMLNPSFSTPVLENIRRIIPKQEYISGPQIVINKILCGDKSDNIASFATFKKNNRTYGFTDKDYLKLQGKVTLLTVEQAISSKEQIINEVLKSKKFQVCSREEMSENFDYNTKLVWLDYLSYPQGILEQMKNLEYKQKDMTDIRSDYHTLLKQDDYISSLFDEL